VVFSELNLGAPTGTLPDGRQEFWVNTLPASFANNRTPNNRPNKNPAFTNVIELSNTDAGNSRNITASLEKPFADDWYAKIAYTRGTGKEVSPGTSSVALSNWQNRTVFNPNEQVANTANYVFKDRVTAQLRKTWHFFTDSPTSAGLFYEGRSGRPYSYAFTGDANGDGQSFNDVFTVPNLATAQYSANSTAADIAAFQDYVTGNAYLNSHQGDVTRRNAVSAPFINYFDLNLTQKFPLVWKTQGEVYVNILNLGNLLNKHWGQIDEAAFPYSLGVARFAGVNNGQVVYDVSSFVNEGTGKVNNPALIRKDVAGESRWTVQVGFRIEF
jgi:hypothetical protein